jgi:hypothetical protein
MSGIKKRGEREKGEKCYFSFPSSCLGPLYFMYNIPKLRKFFGKRELGKWSPSRSLRTRMKGKRRKGKKPALSSAPGFSGEAQGNNSAEDFGVMTKIRADNHQTEIRLD